MRQRLAGTSVGILLLLLAGTVPAQEETSCTSCHGDPDWFDQESASMIDLVREGAHGEAGLSCHDCHGGNPSLEVAEDPEAAMDEGYEPNPYQGVPDAPGVPEFCGSCHSDAEYMKRFRPDIRIDQVREYRTSHHGRALAAGDTKVATCVDCHGVHGILGPDSPESPVYPTEIAETCRSCHGDPEYMEGYQTPDGRPLPTDQYGAWRRSVHAEGLFEDGDLSAPTCNDCHGNHGATPPGVDSITFVCGQCHGREAGLFRESTKAGGFQEHNEFLQAAEGCADCHGDPQASVTGMTHFSECSPCHGNHAIVEPAVTMLSPLPEIPCAFCHEPVGGAVPVPEPEEVERHYEEVKEGLVDAAREEGLEGTALFDHLVEKARNLEFHTRPGEEEGRVLRPEFERLYEKFRLGKTHFTYEVRDKERRRDVVRCEDCHGPEPDMVEDAVGYETSERM
ncbi:MAG: cytochrome c3 family protein, partial [Thermoanaerobaculia bacterium]|nr:cytochrome c3 family protein [Thermoanaerobaculia bacterium]